MRIAARWFGWGSLTAALAATAGLTWHPGIVTEHGDNVFYEVSVSGHDDEAAVQACLDHGSGLVSIDRDEDQRAVTVRVEAGGPLARCIADAALRTPRLVTPPPASVYFHDRSDPWAPTTEPALFPPRTYRC